MKYKEFLASITEADVVARADYKVGPSGRKSHKEIVFHDGTPNEDAKEKELRKEETEEQRKDREEQLKKFKAQTDGNCDETGLEEAFINGREYASHGLMHPDHAKLHKTGDSRDFYAHGTGDKISGKVTHNDGKSVHIQADKSSGGKLHKFKVTPHLPKQQNEAKDTVVKDSKGNIVSFKHEGDWKKTNPKKDPEGKVHNLAGQALKKAQSLNKEEAELEEQAPVAPSIGVHRIGVTVSEPDHPAVSKRKETQQKFVRVTAHDKDKAIEQGKKHFAKKGFKVHDAHHAGMIHEETISESDHDPWHDAQENKKSADAAHKQGDHFAYHMHMADHHSNMAHWSSNRGRYHVADQHQAKADQHHDWAMKHKNGLKKEEVELEEGQDMSKLTYKEFLAKLDEQLLEYTPGPGGVTRVQGRSYGAQYHDPEGDDDADDKPKAKPADAPKRGRGRPAGAKSGANQKVTSGKSYGGIATHSLHLPNSNR